MAGTGDFEEFVRDVDPKLRRALSAHVAREDVADAVAVAFEHAWKHWSRVRKPGLVLLIFGSITVVVLSDRRPLRVHPAGAVLELPRGARADHHP